jgi:hypothetical protein
MRHGGARDRWHDDLCRNPRSNVKKAPALNELKPLSAAAGKWGCLPERLMASFISSGSVTVFWYG